MKKLYVTLALAFITAPSAHAVRTTAVMPIQMNTVHGGSNGGAASYCVTADMQQPVGSFTPASSFASSAGMLASGTHWYTFNFRNLSAIQQDITISVEPGSQIKANYSTNQPAPATTGPSTAVSGIKKINIGLGPNASKTFNILVGCSQSSCWIAGDGGTLAGTVDSSPTHDMQCLSIVSQMQFSLSVAQDRGAVIASIATSAHRHFGYADKYQQPPPFILVNGGRPF